MIAFEWHETKAKANDKKHHVSFEEAMTCFYDSKQVAFYDPEHSDNEDRELLIGHSNKGRLLIVSYTLRDEIIRIISARLATKREILDYARGI